MNTFILLAICFGYTSSEPHPDDMDVTIRMRVVGGSETSIQKYPSASSVHMIDRTVGFSHICGGAVVTQRHVLTAAHCFKAATSFSIDPKRYKVRVGSALAHSGGTLHRINLVMLHPKWNQRALTNDLAILRTETNIMYSNAVRPGPIAGFTHRLRDNESLWAVGWGITEYGHESEQLRDVEVLAINPNLCKGLYKHYRAIPDTILCTGWFAGGSHDQCTRDSGSPVYHNGVVVGIASQGRGCGQPEFPGINVRVSSYASWIRDMTKTTNIRP